jgi:hypothetical protein
MLYINSGVTNSLGQFDIKFMSKYSVSKGKYVFLLTGIIVMNKYSPFNLR